MKVKKTVEAFEKYVWKTLYREGDDKHSQWSYVYVKDKSQAWYLYLVSTEMGVDYYDSPLLK